MSCSASTAHSPQPIQPARAETAFCNIVGGVTARLLANICPAMLDQMAKNDVPDGRQLRVIAAATKEDQTEVWKQHKPKRGHQAPWGEIAHGLSKVRVLASNARFGNDEAQVFGIIWQEDLFAPADEDSRSTTQVDAYLAA